MSYRPEDFEDLGWTDSGRDPGDEDDGGLFEEDGSLRFKPSSFDMMADTIAFHFRMGKAIDDLNELKDNVLAQEKLHPIERELMQVLLDESRFMKCGGCLKLAETLVKRMRGEV